MQMKKTSTFFSVAKLVYVLGMDELQCSIWLLSAPVNAEKNWAMPEFTGVKYQTSNHHILAERVPFYIDTVLINLNSGEVADKYSGDFSIWLQI